MYLILTASKDAYITNRKTSNNDGRYSNVGDASSLDLFKLQSENNQLKPQAELTLLSLPAINDKFILTDTNGTQQTYTYTNDPSDANTKKINIKLTIKDTINETYTIINNSSQTFEAVEKSNTKIILQQKTEGLSSETNNISNFSSIKVTNFVIKEISKLLLNFNYDEIKKHFNIDSKVNFGAKLRLFDISTGIVKPKNFTLNVFPISSSFDEGIGRDINSFGHNGWVNYITSSRDENNLSYNLWSISGLRSKGSNSDLNIDIITGSNNITYDNTQYFSEGDEDLSIDITNFISQSLSDQLVNNGLVVEFSSSIDENSNTYFVKRFGSRHVKDKTLSPRIDFYFDDSFTKNDNIIYTNTSSRVFLENKQGNFYKNLPFTGSNILDTTKNQLSASLVYLNFSSSHYATQSTDALGQNKPGTYYADFNIDMFSSPLHGYITGSGEIKAKLKWYIVVNDNNNLSTLIRDQDITISTGSNILQSEKFIISDIRFNHNKQGTKDEKMFFVSFVDTIANLDAIKIPFRRKGENLGEVFYSVVDVNTNKEIIPFETTIKGTKMSYEDGDYYFTLFRSSLIKDKQVKFKFFLKDYNNLIIDNDKIFRF